MSYIGYMTSPSRQFLVRQAILNAVPKCWPAAARTYGIAGTLAVMHCGMDDAFISCRILPYILAEFRKLEAQHA